MQPNMIAAPIAVVVVEQRGFVEGRRKRMARQVFGHQRVVGFVPLAQVRVVRRLEAQPQPHRHDQRQHENRYDSPHSEHALSSRAIRDIVPRKVHHVCPSFGSGFDRDVFSRAAIIASMEPIHENPASRGSCREDVGAAGPDRIVSRQRVDVIELELQMWVQVPVDAERVIFDRPGAQIARRFGIMNGRILAAFDDVERGGTSIVCERTSSSRGLSTPNETRISPVGRSPLV